jgi:hypothetical protein
MIEDSFGPTASAQKKIHVNDEAILAAQTAVLTRL